MGAAGNADAEHGGDEPGSHCRRFRYRIFHFKPHAKFPGPCD
jgi:hypothetical protein